MSVSRCPSASSLDDFVRGVLPVAERLELEEHLDACQACRRATVRMLSLVDHGSAASMGTSPPASGARPFALRAGDKVGRHIVIGRLGAGSMGTVYAAYDTKLDRRIALKFLVATDEPAATRLLAEASAMARLSHPNVVTVLDVGTLDGRPFLAMEYVKGQTLLEWKHQRSPSVREILAVMAAVAQGLEAAHAAGIIHRDVKPHNVLVSGGRVLVTDFGLSVRDGAEVARAVAGTPAYMAPEQFLGEPATRATDLFGFSVTLYELLYGQHPFGTGSFAELRGRVMTGQIQPPPARSRVPRHVQRLVMAGLSVQPSARPASMGAVAAALLSNPGRQAWRAGTALVTAGAVGAAFWIGGYLRADPEHRCQASAAVIDGAWNGQRRQQLLRQFTAAGQLATGALVERRFDEYAADWRRAQGQTCTATFSQRRISSELFDARMHCLDSHRATFAALVAAVPQATPAQLMKLAGTQLPPVAECDFNDRRFTKPLPADPVSRKRLAEIDETLAQAGAARALGDLLRSRQLATSAVSAARTLAYDPVLAAALIQLAQLEERGAKRTAGDDGSVPETMGPDRALPLLEEASRVADRGGDDASRADAAQALALAHRDAGRVAEAERWAEVASATIGRLGDPPLARAALDYVRGWIYYDRRKWDQSEAAFAHSLELRRQVLGPRAPEVLSSKTSGCHVMERPKRIACYREAIELARTISGPRNVDLANIQANLGGTLLSDARTRPEACRLLADAVDLERKVLEPNSNTVLFAENLLAQCVRDEGKVEEARRIYLEAIRSATHPTGARGDLLQDYGVFLEMQKDYESAAHYFKASIADRELVYGPIHTMPMETRYRLADAYRRAGRNGDALAELDRAIAMCERAGATPIAYPTLYELKGYTLSRMGRAQEGYRALQRAAEIQDRIHIPFEARYDTFDSLGDAALKLGKLDEAVRYLEQALETRPLESKPADYAVSAFRLADALAERRELPHACQVAHRALAGFSSPFGGSLDQEVKEVRAWIKKHHCPPPDERERPPGAPKL
jgi:tetratricopeptide (TPR) repeat protein